MTENVQPEADGYITIEYVNTPFQHPVKVFRMAEFRAWRKTASTIELLRYLPPGASRERLVIIPLSNIRQMEVTYNSADYIQKHKAWMEIEHIDHVAQNVINPDCPSCRGEQIQRQGPPYPEATAAERALEARRRNQLKGHSL